MHTLEPGEKAGTEVGLPLPLTTSASRTRILGLMESGPTGTKSYRALGPGTPAPHNSTYATVSLLHLTAHAARQHVICGGICNPPTPNLYSPEPTRPQAQGPDTLAPLRNPSAPPPSAKPTTTLSSTTGAPRRPAPCRPPTRTAGRWLWG